MASDRIIEGVLTKISSGKELPDRCEYIYIELDGIRYDTFSVPDYLNDFFRDCIGKKVELSTLGGYSKNAYRVVVSMRCQGQMEKPPLPSIAYTVQQLTSAAHIIVSGFVLLISNLVICLLISSVFGMRFETGFENALWLSVPITLYLHFFHKTSALSLRRRQIKANSNLRAKPI